MSQSANLALAQEFLGHLGAGNADEVAELFTEDMVWEIPGDEGALPWIGKKSGRGAIRDFMNQSGELMERISFEVDDLLASDNRAVVLGHLQSRLKANDGLAETYFALILTTRGGKISRFQMLEDSHAISKAARG